MPFLGAAIMSPPTIFVCLCHHIHELKVLEWFCPIALGIQRVAVDSIAVGSISSWVGTHGRAHPPVSSVGVGGFAVPTPQDLPICDYDVPYFLHIYLLSCYLIAF